jgi:hypothetical protein
MFTPRVNVRPCGTEFLSTPGVRLELPLEEISGSDPEYFVMIKALNTCPYTLTELMPDPCNILSGNRYPSDTVFILRKLAFSTFAEIGHEEPFDKRSPYTTRGISVICPFFVHLSITPV